MRWFKREDIAWTHWPDPQNITRIVELHTMYYMCTKWPENTVYTFILL